MVAPLQGLNRGGESVPRALPWAIAWRPVGAGEAGAHSQGETLDELNSNLHEVIEMLLE